MTESQFILEVQRLSLENKGFRKVFFLNHSDYYTDSLMYLEVENYEAAKEIFKKIFKETYDENHYDRVEGFNNDKPVFIHFAISKTKSE